MGDEAVAPVTVSRRIKAPAADVFRQLCDPATHPAIDGSGMLREGGSTEIVSAVGDVFAMKMEHPNMGEYVMDNYVTVFEPDRRIGWNPVNEGTELGTPDGSHNGSKWTFELSPDGPGATIVTEMYDCSGSPGSVRSAVENGTAWIGAMTDTLQKLDELCTQVDS
jgi:uncharacterized protein YndB with AHSA1/START domain